MIALFLAAATPQAAAPSPAFTACMQDRSVTAEMLACGKAEIARWDARLNAAYRALLRRGSPRQQAALRAEQRQWLAHHVAATRRLAAAPDNGSAAFLESQSFELSDLSQRVVALERRVRA